MTTDNPNDLFLKVNDFARLTSWLHGPMTAYAKYGLLIFAALLVAGWWIARDRPAPVMAAALLAPVAAALAVGITQPIVKTVKETRPYVVHPHALVLVSRSSDPSFPSDHATMAGAVAVGLLFVSWRLGLVAAFFAVVMAFARVYVGAHFPHDVVVGLVVGGAVGGAVWVLLRIPVTRLVERLRATGIRPLVGSSNVYVPAAEPAESMAGT